jgi:hypothetical protein
MARVFTEVLLEDAEFPIAGQPAYTYFLTLTMEEAATAYEQIYDLPFWDRPRDFMERMGMDGRVA